MIYKDIKVGKTYEVKRFFHKVNVKVTKKWKKNGNFHVEYELPEMDVMGCTKAWQISETNDFPNIRTIAE